jgi:hypothetical protein
MDSTPAGGFKKRINRKIKVGRGYFAFADIATSDI